MNNNLIDLDNRQKSALSAGILIGIGKLKKIDNRITQIRNHIAKYTDEKYNHWLKLAGNEIQHLAEKHERYLEKRQAEKTKADKRPTAGKQGLSITPNLNATTTKKRRNADKTYIF